MPDREPDMRKPSGQTVFLGAVVLGSCLLVGYIVLRPDSGGPDQGHDPPTAGVDENPVPAAGGQWQFNGRQSYKYLEQICRIGPRPSGSPGMEKQQQLLVEHFQALGGQVRLQKFRGRHPLTGAAVPMANLIVHWHPDRTERVLLCAHYDTRPFPDRDRRNPKGTFIGANDGGSGVALLMELAHGMKSLDGKYGVDFVLFDAEELIFPAFPKERGKYCLGSEYFADDYVKNPPPHQYAAGILLDMVADADLQIYYEVNSMKYANTRKLVVDIWTMAARLGVREFIQRKGHEVKDDHLPLNKTAKIPTCDIIDFDYPHWHTEGDTLDKCSGESLEKVGRVVDGWLRGINRPKREGAK